MCIRDRETRGNFEKRKQEGCIAVEMECASVQAVCDFRGVEFYNFLKSGDLLDAPEWDPRSELGNNGSQHDPRYFMMAPVSYTHLDVYKRQEPYRSLVTKENISMLLGECLEVIKENKGLEVIHVEAADGTFVSIRL